VSESWASVPPVQNLSGRGTYHAPEVVRISVRLLEELLDALYGVEARDRGRLIADLAHLIAVARESGWALPVSSHSSGEVTA
jgi:hypothetical protein